MVLFAHGEQQERRLCQPTALGVRQLPHVGCGEAHCAGAHQGTQEMPVQCKDILEIVPGRSLVLHRGPHSGVLFTC